MSPETLLVLACSLSADILAAASGSAEPGCVTGLSGMPLPLDGLCSTAADGDYGRSTDPEEDRAGFHNDTAAE